MKDTHTRHRPIRVDDELWNALGALVGERNRSSVIRDFIRWFVGARGAKMPRRPQSWTPDITIEVTEGPEWRPPLDDPLGPRRLSLIAGDQALSIEISGDPDVTEEFALWLRVNAGSKRREP